MTHELRNEITGVAVVLVAAGRGERAGGLTTGPKQYRTIAGKPVIRHTLEHFLQHPAIGPVVVAIHEDDAALFADAVKGLEERVSSVTGGSTRQASTLRALEALSTWNPEKVLIHDAVRPFVDAKLLDRVIEAIDEDHGVLPALAVSDTLKRGTEDKLVGETVSRENLFAAQTPQGFPYARIHKAHEVAHAQSFMDFTDDSAIAEWAGLRMKLVRGSAANTKITWPEDLQAADQKMKALSMNYPDVRTGNGYDVHSFEDGEFVTLCGVQIPHAKKLSGHSDADVGLHALTDALLATCGAGDIGTHFPPSDPQWKGAASHLFVEHAVKIVRQRGGRIANADITLICEAPRIGPHREAMTAELARMLCISEDRISVKATTNEKLGFVGREEGIAAIATASVVYPGQLPE
ncbi:bifunctional 2-C-methyl-D-erythritol 4-phosphate cytidylyltransferase/2-C-methyl-D-erythritol 2,4-cyclodiphosphate synthase [Nitratireductor basaltis]|uniref:Bifunctional enzyme IspD/IspF n=1 Tax=Nitratireductor basaltis TaxID=472175 RepID=A0A084UAK1_9HYPH|nr:bifunctional 2-C-methyl-D-erythritol 4-phosphate cytidylyltransferase/2-C-methyl-D-erythritol 2,4-cyclodiphosphate synthase [Nitratireductor basaltis]KFB09987.1 Bifunctional enzyme IspD/IspF [Nitratireductor basaltis]